MTAQASAVAGSSCGRSRRHRSSRSRRRRRICPTASTRSRAAGVGGGGGVGSSGLRAGRSASRFPRSRRCCATDRLRPGVRRSGRGRPQRRRGRLRARPVLAAIDQRAAERLSEPEPTPAVGIDETRFAPPLAVHPDQLTWPGSQCCGRTKRRLSTRCGRVRVRDEQCSQHRLARRAPAD